MMNMVGVAIAQPLIGVLLDKFWMQDPLNQALLQVNHAERIYQASEYIKAVSILPLGILIAILLLPFIKETYCKPNI